MRAVARRKQLHQAADEIALKLCTGTAFHQAADAMRAVAGCKQLHQAANENLLTETLRAFALKLCSISSVSPSTYPYVKQCHYLSKMVLSAVKSASTE